MSTTRVLSGNQVSTMAGLALALGATAVLTGCGGTASGATPSASLTSARAPRTATSEPTTTAPAPAEPSATQVPLGDTVTLPSDTVTVTRLLPTSAPDARKPDTPGTHWASFDVKQCAVTDSRQGSWKIALADGTFASEPTSWPEELPGALLPSDEMMPPGYCVQGRVYIAMPDGATATAVVLEPRAGQPGREQVEWVVGRTSAAS